MRHLKKKSICHFRIHQVYAMCLSACMLSFSFQWVYLLLSELCDCDSAKYRQQNRMKAADMTHTHKHRSECVYGYALKVLPCEEEN